MKRASATILVLLSGCKSERRSSRNAQGAHDNAYGDGRSAEARKLLAQTKALGSSDSDLQELLKEAR
jgi:hypothetical protein